MKYEAIIFDIDGTLISTNQLIFDTFNYVADKYLNKKFTNDQIIAMFGPPEEVILRELFPENLNQVREDYYDYYKSNHSIAKTYPGIKELIEEIKMNNGLLSVFTGKGKRSSMITLEEIGIADHFDMIVTGDDVTNHKPAPDGILKFVESFKLPKEKVLMVGDAVSDIKAASEADIDYVSVLWDSYGHDQVLQINKNKFFHKVSELREYILS